MHYWCPIGIPVTCRKKGASQTNVDVVDKKVKSETKLATREVCVPHGHPIIRPEGAKIIGSNEAFPFRVKNSFQKIMKSGVRKASIKSRKVPSTCVS